MSIVPEVLAVARNGQPAQAESMARSMLAQAPDDYDAIVALGIVARSRKQTAEAGKRLAQAIAIDPARAEAHLELAHLHRQAGRTDAALASLRIAAECRPQLADAWFGLGDLLRERGDSAGATEAYESTIRLDPGHGEAHNNLGALLRERGDAGSALAAFREAVRLRPKLSFAWFNLGTLLRDRGELDAAIDALRTSLALDPRQADAQYWLGNALMGRGDAAEAAEAYRAALRIDAQMLAARWGLTMAQIVPVPDSAAAETASREAFAHELEKLATWCRTRRPNDGFRAVGAQQPYYLAYQQQSNKDLLGQYGRLCVELMRPWEKKVGLPAAPRSAGGKCRVGIVSAHFHNHSVWNAIVRGWVEHIDRSRVDLHLFHIGDRKDAETAFASRQASKFHGQARDWSLWASAIVESKLDVLVYPEVGMDAVTAKLAAARLCPIQVASWGHPETSGLPSLDYFVSAAAMEPLDAATHYSEGLVTLPGLGCCYKRFGTAPAPVDLQGLGIPRGARVLLCAGMPFKYTPAHDPLFVEIAKQAAPCRLVFFRSTPQALAKRLEARLRVAFAKGGVDFDAHVIFVPLQSQAAFFGLMTAADVFLDSPGFSGFNTAMQAIECGLPIVALEGAFLRGRFASGILQQMGLDAWVADSADGYVERAVRLTADRDLRARVRRQIEERRAPLFDHVASAKAMQDFLLNVAASGSA